ncbi:MAG TPA: zinc metallopeptidase, partial [Anaerolineae bacterium]|nr:zinc metallopeptidase [Anaerolineae bacterium]
MFYLDPLYLMIFGVTLVISLAAQMYIESAYGKWSKVANSHNLTGLQVGQELLRDTGLGATYQMSSGTGVQFQGVGGNLTDHYDPRTHTVGLSQAVATQPSVASMAIVAHELGHAQQYATKSPLIAARSFLLPAMRVSPMISYGLIMMGFVFNFVGAIYLGIFFFGITVLFSVITLPVEFDASRRAMILLGEAGLLTSAEDEKGARTVLRAAAATYVAATVTAILQLLYYLS